MTKYLLALLLSVSAFATTSVSNKQFISELAEEAGEYFDYHNTDFARNVKPIAVRGLPRKVLQFAKKETLKISNEIAEHEGITCGCAEGEFAFLEDAQFAITKNGRVIGYVIAVHHDLYHPLWDGSGDRIFILFNRNKIVEVARVGWSG